MDMDRRTFSGALLAGAGAAAAGFPGAAEAAVPRYRATLVVDATSGRVIRRTGLCGVQFTPCSTFKVPLALMGFDSGILQDAHHPAWKFDPKVHTAYRETDRHTTDPTRFEADSVIWFSREITRRLGAARFKAYIDRFGYGNRDVTGNPGKNDGLTNSWLASSLKISPDEQVAFLRRLLAGGMASAAAHARTLEVLPDFAGSGGWSVHGKTGSGSLKDVTGKASDTGNIGWFVGWADKGRRRVVFARFGAGAGMPVDDAGGPAMRKAMLAEIGALAG